jgi:hypothetical protein
MNDLYRQAVDAAVTETGRPLTEIQRDEAATIALMDRVIEILIQWDVWRTDSDGRILPGSQIGEANDARRH